MPEKRGFLMRQNPVKLTDPDIVFRLIIANCYSNHGMPDTVRLDSMSPHTLLPCLLNKYATPGVLKRLETRNYELSPDAGKLECYSIW